MKFGGIAMAVTFSTHDRTDETGSDRRSTPSGLAGIISEDHRTKNRRERQGLRPERMIDVAMVMANWR